MAKAGMRRPAVKPRHPRARRLVIPGLAILFGSLAAPAAADIDVSPADVTVAPGAESPVLQLTVTNAVPSTGAVAIAVSGLPPGASTLPSPVTVQISRTGTASASFAVTTSPTTRAGTYVVTLSGPAALRVGSTSLRLTVPVSGVSVLPASVTVVAGASSTPLTIQVSNVGVPEVLFTASLPAAIVGRVTVEPHPVRVPIDRALRTGSGSFRLLTAAGTPAGTHLVVLRDATFGLSVSLALVVQPVAIVRPPPVIQTVTPGTLVAESLNVALRLTGVGFEAGAQLAASDPTLMFGPVRVLAGGVVETTVSVRSDAPPGVRQVTLVNPDGRRASARVVILPPDSLAAPLTVRTVAIVHPAPGRLLAMDEALRPRGLLAVAGTGTVVGTWQLDGVPFERFSAPARAGLPVEVQASMPVPRTALGEHRLQLAIETPQRLISAAVPVVLVTERESRLRLLAPRDGAVLARPPFAFGWSVVPGVESYEVELLGGDGRASRRLVTSVPRWEPSPGSLQPGVHRWRVRPVFPGGVRGEATESRRIAVLPAAVRLRIVPASTGGTSSLRWEGGTPGLLYRVELLRDEGGSPLFSALTTRPSYRLPGALGGRPQPIRARVTALAPGGVALGSSTPVQLPPSAPARLLVAARPPARILARRPAPSSSVSTAHPAIGAEWDVALPAGETTLVVDDVDVTAVARVTERGVEYGSLLPLAAGEHVVSLVLGDQIERWTFQVDSAAPAPAPEERKTPPPAWTSEGVPASTWADWAVSLEGTVMLVTGDLPDEQWTGRASLSGQLDIEGARGLVRAAGDLSASTSDAPGEGASRLENRNWLLTGGPRQGRFREEASVGYAPPNFLGGSELLSAGLARGGAQATLAGPAVELAFYETFDSDFAGVATGGFAPSQRLRAAGLTLGKPGGKLGLRLLGLRTEEDAGGFSAGGEGRVYGVLGTYQPRSAWTLLFEGARGEHRPSASGFGTPREGYALRMAVTGSTGGWGFRLNVRKTEADFVNPANRGLTPGGVSDRTGGDLEITRAIGRSLLRVAVRHLEGGSAAGLSSAAGRQDGGEAQLSLQLGAPVSLLLGGSLTATRSDGDSSLPLPATDQTDRTAQLQVSERLGAFSLIQSASYQLTDDWLDPTRRNEVASGGLSLAGPVGEHLSLFANATAMRVEGEPAYGRTDSLLVAVQPSLSLARVGLTALPYVSWNRTRNDLLATETESASYQLTVLWNPRLLRSLFSLQASADWTRVSAGDQPSQGFVARYTFGVTLRRGAGSRSLARPAAPPTPGRLPPGLSPGVPPPGPTGTIS